MIYEKNLQFSDSQALTATAASSDHLDLSQDRDIGPGTPLWLVVISRVAPGGTNPTISISIETDDNPSFSSPVALVAGPAVAGASFPAGGRIVMPFPHTNERYVRAKYTLGGTDPTFTIDAFLTSQEPPNWQALPDAI